MVTVLNLFVHILVPHTCTYAYAGIAESESSGATDAPPARKIVSIHPETGEQGFKVHIIADGRLRDYESFRLLSPHRLVIDLPNVQYSLEKKTLLLDSLLVKKIHLHPYKDKLRIIFDLFPIAELPYKVFSQDNQLIVFLGGASGFGTIEPTVEVGQAQGLSATEPVGEARTTSPTTILQQTKTSSTPAELAPEELLPATHDAKIGLHFSSCLLKANAEIQIHRLERYGYNSFCQEEEVLGKKWFRVYILGFKNAQEARRVGSELKKKGVISYYRPRKID